MLAHLAVVMLVLGSNGGWPAADPGLPADALSRPEAMPDDPLYRPGIDPVLGCSGQLELYSFTPACTAMIVPPERDLMLGSGIHADRAWLWTIGRPEVAIAVLDSAVDASDPDLVLRIRLNPGELPIPAIAGASTWDVNHDGIFNVQDYTSATGTVVPTRAMIIDRTLLARPDRGDVNNNGILDPEDLILAFSNGADEDHDGFIDDIAGWDFIAGDNDPFDRSGVTSSSGTLYARAILGTANNGYGGAGVCPRCALIAVRVADRGLASGNALAAAIVFSADSGASVIAALSSAAGGAGFLRAAAAYAIGRGTPIIAASGNGSSLRQEMPWDPDQVFVVGSIGYDQTRRDLALSALSPDPCSNFGPTLSAAAPGRCDASPAALAAGTMGLVLSSALGIEAKSIDPLVPALSPIEAFQILAESADDITRLYGAADTGMRMISSPMPPPGVLVGVNVQEGWDERTGFGRIDARRAVDLVVQRSIPPEAQILSPPHFTMIDPSPISGFQVSARVKNTRYASVSWVLEYAVGTSPSPDGFSTIAAGSVDAGRSLDVFGTVTTDGLFPDPTAPPESPSAYAITLRLTAGAEGLGAARAEARRVIFVHRDLSIFPAFPMSLGAGIIASPRVLDFNGDGYDEIVAATEDGLIHAVDGRGHELPGWPVALPNAPVVAAHGAERAYQDGAVLAAAKESVIATPSLIAFPRSGPSHAMIAAVTDSGRIFAYDASGQLQPGFPVATSSIGAGELAGSPVLFDIDGDGHVDILQVSGHGALHAIDVSGKELAGFPVSLEMGAGAPSIGDIDGDGSPDIVVASTSHLFLLHRDGRPFAGSPIALADREAGLEASGIALSALPSPAIADVDGDGVADIVLATRGRPLLVFQGTGMELVRTASDRSAFGAKTDALTSGDPVLGDGSAIAVGSLGRAGPLGAAGGIASRALLAGLPPNASIEHLAAAFSLLDGSFTEGSPRLIGDPGLGGAVLADLDGDRRPEILIGDGYNRVDAFSADGTRPNGWPKLTGGWVAGALAIGDIDGDGHLDVVAATRSGQLFAWRTSGPTNGVIPWPGYRHDAQSTGNISTPIALLAKSSIGSSCSCRDARPRPAGTLIALLLALLCRGLRARPPSPAGQRATPRRDSRRGEHARH
jgi:hypothetical protein